MFYKWKIPVISLQATGTVWSTLWIYVLLQLVVVVWNCLYFFVPKGTPGFPWLVWNSLELGNLSRTFWAQLELTLFTAQPLKTNYLWIQLWYMNPLATNSPCWPGICILLLNPCTICCDFLKKSPGNMKIATINKAKYLLMTKPHKT